VNVTCVHMVLSLYGSAVTGFLALKQACSPLPFRRQEANHLVQSMSMTTLRMVTLGSAFAFVHLLRSF